MYVQHPGLAKTGWHCNGEIAALVTTIATIREGIFQLRFDDKEMSVALFSDKGLEDFLS